MTNETYAHEILTSKLYKLITNFTGEHYKSRKNFDELMAFYQIHQTFPPSNFYTMRYFVQAIISITRLSLFYMDSEGVIVGVVTIAITIVIVGILANSG